MFDIVYPPRSLKNVRNSMKFEEDFWERYQCFSGSICSGLEISDKQNDGGPGKFIQSLNMVKQLINNGVGKNDNIPWLS